ncbi:efflux RND transporter periplasmic adaptor subunit [Hymenobacter gummosus]|uniref:Efflux RND transporter periplasmic adaptor subunit n=1 Tax=Hymenobacter gummosus TaxID=1776032 RepID=A0A3S0ILC6_9BACT|nr:efflux RND transporter periplasmic adaptor subunit [Hymenobacter gummosus]RTQ47488.1 efflux RND transporter periplasmic adaptor subunit [Hymenobacter gummosus]
MPKFLILITVLLLGSACGRETPAAEETTPPAATEEAAPDQLTLSPDELQLAGVRVGPLEQRVMSGGIKVNGVLDVPPDQLLAVSAPLGGFVERTSLLQGTQVRKGQELAVIRNPEFVQLQQRFLEVQSRLRYARAELARQRELVQQEVAPLKRQQSAQADVDVLEAEAAGLRAQLRLAGLPVGAKTLATTAVLRAPIDAFVKTVNVSVGQAVTPTDALFELVDPRHLHVELTVFEQDVPRLKHGQRIHFTVASDSAGPQRTAEVYLIGRAVDAQQRTVRVHGHLDKENDPQLLPGMFVRAVVETSAERVPALPAAAVVDYEGRQYVFVAKTPASFRLVEVRRGTVAEGYAQVQLPPSLDAARTSFVTEGAYALLGKLKNAAEEE